MGAVWLRVRGELRSRWRSTLAVTALVAIAGATVLTACAGARRASTSVDRFLAETRMNDALVIMGSPVAPADPRVFDEMEALPEVEAMGRYVFYGAFVEGVGFLPLQVSVDRELGRRLNRFPIVDGRRAAPDAVDEMVLTESTADRLDLSVGDRVRIQTFAPDQAEEFAQEASGEPTFRGPHAALTVVGVQRTGQELVSRPEDVVPVTLTPAFYRRYGGDILQFASGADVVLRGGTAAVSAFQERVAVIAGPDAELRVESIASYTDSLDKAADVVAVGLWIFAGTAALAALVALGVVVGRQALIGARDDVVLAAMGMRRVDRCAANLLPLTIAAVTGGALATAGAILASPLMPIGGLVRQIEPDLGLDVDGFVLLAGFASLVAVVAAVAAVATWREGGRATMARPVPTRPGPAWLVAQRLAGAGAGPAAVTGVRMAFEPGRGRTAVPVRPALVGAIAGVTGLVAALTFGAGLGRFTETPKRYGFGWDVAVADAEAPDLGGNGDIAAVADGLFQLPLAVDGYPVNATAIEPIKGEVFTTVIEGEPARAADEIVLGTDTLENIGRSVGDTVEVRGVSETRPFRIVGRGVFPSPEDPYPFADGAAITGDAASELGLTDFTDAVGRQLVVWRDGIDEDAAAARLAREYEVEQPTAPPDVQRLDQIAVLPEVLAGFLGFLAVLAVGYALVTAVHRRRRDFAVLETIGFVGRQVSSTVAWQASALAVVGLAVGVPLGLAAGRWAWVLVAEGLGIATDPTIPIAALAIAVPLALLVANAIAFVPGRMAARTRPAIVLRSE